MKASWHSKYLLGNCQYYGMACMPWWQVCFLLVGENRQGRLLTFFLFNHVCSEDLRGSFLYLAVRRRAHFWWSSVMKSPWGPLMPNHEEMILHPACFWCAFIRAKPFYLGSMLGLGRQEGWMGSAEQLRCAFNLLLRLQTSGFQSFTGELRVFPW